MKIKEINDRSTKRGRERENEGKRRPSDQTKRIVISVENLFLQHYYFFRSFRSIVNGSVMNMHLTIDSTSEREKQKAY